MKLPELLRDAPAQSQLQLRASLAAWRQVTHVPLPRKLIAYSKQDTPSPEQQVRYLPLAAIVTGLMASLVYLAIEAVTGSRDVGILAALLTNLLLTAGLKPASGFSNMVLLVIAWQLLALLPSHLIVGSLVAAQAYASFAAFAFLYTHRPAQPKMQGRYAAFSQAQLEHRDFIVMAAFGMLPVMVLGNPLFFVLLPALWVVRALLGAFIAQPAERYTSDALTAVRQGIELGFYFGVVIIFHGIAGS